MTKKRQHKNDAGRALPLPPALSCHPSRTCIFFNAVWTGADTGDPGGASMASDVLMGREYEAEAPDTPRDEIAAAAAAGAAAAGDGVNKIV